MYILDPKKTKKTWKRGTSILNTHKRTHPQPTVYPKRSKTAGIDLDWPGCCIHRSCCMCTTLRNITISWLSISAGFKAGINPTFHASSSLPGSSAFVPSRCFVTSRSRRKTQKKRSHDEREREREWRNEWMEKRKVEQGDRLSAKKSFLSTLIILKAGETTFPIHLPLLVFFRQFLIIYLLIYLIFFLFFSNRIERWSGLCLRWWSRCRRSHSDFTQLFFYFSRVEIFRLECFRRAIRYELCGHIQNTKTKLISSRCKQNTPRIKNLETSKHDYETEKCFPFSTWLRSVPNSMFMLGSKIFSFWIWTDTCWLWNLIGGTTSYIKWLFGETNREGWYQIYQQ